MGAEEDGREADRAGKMACGSLGELEEQPSALPTIGLVPEAHLDQLVGEQRFLHLRQHGRGQPSAADADDQSQVVG